MKFVAICNAEFEDICAEEIKTIIPKAKKIITKKELVFFECTKEEVALLIYRTQGIKRILKVIVETEKIKEKEIISSVKKGDFSEITGSFASRAQNTSLERTIGAAIFDILENPKVDLKHPDFEIYTHKTDIKTITGIDLSGDLSKRSYKIFPHSESVKGTLAYFLVWLSGYSGKNIFLDPCSGSGTLCTEAALFASGLSPRYYDKHDLFQTAFFSSIDVKSIIKDYDQKSKKLEKSHKKTIKIQGYDIHLPAVNAMKKNFKIAGVDQYISSGRGDIDWLETKFKENSVDHIACNPPLYAKHNEKRNDKFYDILFYQCEFIMTKKGRLVVLTNNPKIDSFAKKYKLKLLEQREFLLGTAKRYIFVFGK